MPISLASKGARIIKRLGYLAILLLLLAGLLIPAVYSPKNPNSSDISALETGSTNMGDVLPTEPSADGPATTGKAADSKTPFPSTDVVVGQERPAAEVGKAADDEKSKRSSPVGPQEQNIAELPKDNNAVPITEPEANDCVVEIAIVGMGGQIIYGPTSIVIGADNKWGATVLGALEATGLPYNMSSAYSKLVLGIAEQQNKGMCGWMYKVNDQVAMKAAGDFELNSGDKVIWWYSEDPAGSSPSWGDF